MNKVIKIVLCLLFCFGCFTTPIQAKTNENRCLIVYNENDDDYRQILVKAWDDQIYIEQSDLMFISGCVAKKYKGIYCGVRNGAVLMLSSQPMQYNGKLYFPLEQSCDDLNVSAPYHANGNILYCRYYLTNAELAAMCKKCLDDERLAVDFGYEGLKGKALWTSLYLAYLYNIVGGSRVDAAFGVYQEEVYEKAYWGLIDGVIPSADGYSDVTSIDAWVSGLKSTRSTNKTLKKVYSAAKEFFVDQDYIDKGFTVFNYDLLSEYGITKDGVKSISKITGIAVDTAVSLAEDCRNAEKAEKVYTNALYYTINKSSTKIGAYAYDSACSVLSYFDNGIATGDGLMDDLIKKAAQNTEKTLLKDLAKGIIQTAYVDLEKLILDELGLKETTSAAQQILCSCEIQNNAGNVARIAYSNLLNGKDTVNNAITLKYATILYIRCCQYSHEQAAKADAELPWSVDKSTMSWTVKRWNEITLPMISELAKLDDDAIGLTIKNSPVPASMIPEYRIAQEDLYVRYNPSRKLKQCSVVTNTGSSKNPTYYCFDVCYKNDGFVIDTFALGFETLGEFNLKNCASNQMMIMMHTLAMWLTRSGITFRTIGMTAALSATTHTARK